MEVPDRVATVATAVSAHCYWLATMVLPCVCFFPPAVAAAREPLMGQSRPGIAVQRHQPSRFAGRSIEVFAGSASRPAAEAATKVFARETEAIISLHFGGSGKMLSEIKLSRRGDIYFPGSSDYMELAKREKLVLPETERVVVYLVPAIVVPRGNPRKISALGDLAQPGVRVAIGRPDSVCVGLYGVEILERAGLSANIRPNIVTHAESCEKLAQIVALNFADAALGWRVFSFWDPERIEAIPLAPGEVSRIGYIPVAVSTFSSDSELARQFIDFLVSPRAKAVFEKQGYLVTIEEAKRLATPGTPVGGSWELPSWWK